MNLLDVLAEKIHDGEQRRKLLMGRGSINVKIDKMLGRA